MILRNPSYRRDFLFMACLFFLSFVSIPSHAQGVMGFIKEEGTFLPVTGAIVTLSENDIVITSIITNDEGLYTYQSPIAGRIKVEVRHLGYDIITKEILLDGYTMQRLDLVLPITIFDSPCVVVLSDFQPELLEVTSDELNLTAANFDDPVRVAVSSPGIVQINDQANHLSVRGQNPIFNTWYLEELEIVNPNHTNNAGTFSDQPTQSGGGVNMFSAQALGATNIYVGLNPIEIGRSAGAVIDMSLHETIEPEFRAKAGFLGFELGGGKRIGSNGILDVNLRYSFTGLLADLGVDFGGEKIGFYDGVISFHTEGIRHKLKIFAWGGSSKNNFLPPEEKERYKDFFHIDYANDILGTGFKYTSRGTKKLSFTGGAAYSTLVTKYDKIGTYFIQPQTIRLENTTKVLSSIVELNVHHSTRVITTGGLNFTYKSNGTNEHAYSLFMDESFLRPYINLQMGSSLTKFKLEAGGEINYDLGTFTDEASAYPGYRIVLNWHIHNTFTTYGGARHAAGQNVQTFGTEETFLLPMLIDKYELGFVLRLNRNTLTIKNYLQEIENLAVLNYPGGSLHLANSTDPFFISIFATGNNSGRARFYGIEGEWKYRNEKGWRISANHTFYRSLTTQQENNDARSRFDGQYASHINLSKEIIKVRNEKNRIWNMSLRGIFNGGLWEQTIDEEFSQIAESTRYTDEGIFNQRLKGYHRMDASVSRTITNEKIRWRFALDIQNLLNFTNVAYSYFDPYLNRIETQKQLGIIPVFSVQASWQ